MTLFVSVLLAVFGVSLGSFLSVLTHRTKHKKKGTFFGRSMCPHCKKTLKWNHLVPVISYLALRGKCAYCGKRISKHYFAIEFFTGALMVLIFLNWNFVNAIPSSINPDIWNYSIDWKIFEYFIFYALEGIFLSAIFFYDLLYKEIPDRFSIPAIVLALLGILTLGEPSYMGAGIGVGIIAVFFGGQIVLSKGQWLGGGDLRLGVLMALLLGTERLILALVLSYLIGALIAIPLLIAGKANRKTALPFGPLLIAGLLIALFAGNQLIDLYLLLLLG
ncbi:prepilin peptidase [Candidatus Peregrinibacteria bacterium]|jgi:leader peptidase (prepilin peptidase) / N-methyltransferase|nr:prepilin peptidase [Candidatus Peregrinibacteria bacterium]MBT4056262.1 prepilin peptidase [Candidatus Peregrinibacteria bacterium]